jgi:hypothetical protein
MARFSCLCPALGHREGLFVDSRVDEIGQVAERGEVKPPIVTDLLYGAPPLTIRPATRLKPDMHDKPMIASFHIA